MLLKKIRLQLFIFCVITISSSLHICAEENYIKYVNAFIGNADNGHTFPGACSPFGLIQAGPDSGNGSWKYCSGYNYDDDYIEGFSQTHLNGTGVPDLGDILLYPFCKTTEKVYKSKYDKFTHIATAGYYSVMLTEAAVNVEITATERTAFHRYTFKKKNPRILVDLQRGLVNRPEKVEKRVLEAQVNIVDDYTITGFQKVRGWVDRQLYYVVKFDQPFTYTELPAIGIEKSKRFVLSFETKKGNTVQTKIAISTVSVDGAIVSLNVENPEWNFDIVKVKTQQKWNKLLSRFEVDGSKDEKINFYTSAYHLFIQPNNIADTDGKYRGADDRIHNSPNNAYYSTLSLWDTYRAAQPLYTIITPELVNGFVQTMIDHHKVQGYLPIWTLWGKENHCMIGNHSIPVIVDAYLKGFNDFDAEAAYRAIKESLTASHKNSDWETYDKYGYYPFDIVKMESVSRTLESAYDDYCAAQMAKALGKIEDYEFFMKRAGYYKNLFDPESKLMRGKDSKGQWRTPFHKFHLSHSGTAGGDYTEGNAWQYTWHVQHDVNNLIDLMGGKKNFVTKLDSLFYLQLKVEQSGFVGDVSGLIGQYAHGNEPSHHVIYLYSYADRKDKTQELVREVFDSFYKPKPDGLCGNDDCGQMSAWYIFSALGFYPVNPAGGEYILGAPQIKKVSLKLSNNRTFVIEAKNQSKKNKYVQSVQLNGKSITGISIHHKDIMSGGNLVFIMTDKPQL